MTTTYQIIGMTCQSCVKAVTEKLSKINEVDDVTVDLKTSQAIIDSSIKLPLIALQGHLPEKYRVLEIVEKTNDKVISAYESSERIVSKWVQLRPLFLIFCYLFTATFLLNFKNWDTSQAMLDFMGLFYIVFSFFKFLDLKGFPDSFKMYDPLAKIIPFYGWIYPFIELILGILFLMRLQIPMALMITVIILGITTIGVTRTLLSKKQIRCACLGTALQLPMTEATFIENSIMLVMASIMLVQRF